VGRAGGAAAVPVQGLITQPHPGEAAQPGLRY
jgi:hypothetical protein